MATDYTSTPWGRYFQQSELLSCALAYAQIEKLDMTNPTNAMNAATVAITFYQAAMPVILTTYPYI